MNNTVASQLTNGFGNNIFQYVAGRLLADYHGAYHYVIPPTKDYYAIDCLKEVGVNFSPKKLSNPVSINDRNYRMSFDPVLKNRDLVLNGYFEDYTHYYDSMKKIRSWFPPVEKRKDKALVIHMRTGDRLFMKNEFYTTFSTTLRLI